MCQQQTSRIERLDIYTRPLDHVGPLVCVGCDALSELGRGSRYHGLTQVDQPGLYLGVGETCVDFVIELLHDFRRRAFRRDDSEPLIRFVPGYDFSYGRDVRECGRTRFGSHRERANLFCLYERR